MDNIFEKISLTLILLKIFDIYFFCYLATNEKIAITHLWHAIEPQTMYHLIAKDKVAEQHILGKHSNCNSFGDTMALLNSRNLKVAITQLSMVQQVWNLTMDSLPKSRWIHIWKDFCNSNTFEHIWHLLLLLFSYKWENSYYSLMACNRTPNYVPSYS